MPSTRRSRRAISQNFVQKLSQDTHNRSIALRKNTEVTAATPQTGPAVPVLSEAEQALRQTLLDLTQAAEQASTAAQYPQALALYEQVLTILEADIQLLPMPDSLRMQGLAQLNAGWIHQQTKAYKQALKAYNKAIALLNPLALIARETLANSLMIAHRQRGQVYQALGQHPEAMADLEQSLQFQLQTLGQQPDLEDMAQDWLNLALLQQELEQPSAAISSLKKAHQTLLKAPDPEQQPLLLPVLAQLAQLQTTTGQTAEAYTSYQQLMQAAHSRSPRIWAQYALLQAAFLLEHQDSASPDALAEIHSSVLQLEQQRTEAFGLVEPLLTLADLCRERDLPEDALTFYTDAIRCAERSQTPRSSHFQETLMKGYLGRAGLLLEQGEATKSQQAFRQARRLAQSEDSTLALANIDLQLGLCYQSQQKSELALESFTAAITTFAENVTAGDVLSAEAPLIQALYLRGFLQVLDFNNLPAALQDFEQIETHCPGLAAYDLACLHSRLGQNDPALAYLKQHLTSPYALTQAEILADEDLRPLQNTAAWSTLW
ncbi:MAG: hypothetical protein IGS03_03630 [Candidatus Sericytochromatia bacterium]|nr:hypothetical protein [Candidatus Sericytochromatia bacterium]